MQEGGGFQGEMRLGGLNPGGMSLPRMEDGGFHPLSPAAFCPLVEATEPGHLYSLTLYALKDGAVRAMGSVYVYSKQTGRC